MPKTKTEAKGVENTQKQKPEAKMRSDHPRQDTEADKKAFY